jgi:UDP-N-acetylmuramoyl-tripeptide--D-alanyl-D-alanine ligase
MKPITLQQVRLAVAGRSVGMLRQDMPPVLAVCTDSRQMQPQSLFVALRGERFDGHDYLRQAHAGGAIAAVVERDVRDVPDGLTLIRTDDTRKALGRLAKFVRKQFTTTKVIAVAGSNGKTTTKHLIHAVLSTKLRGSHSPKSYNNDIGVPLTIFAVDPTHDYVVLELGTNHPGEIRNLAEMSLPDIAVITNCSAEHLEGLGDVAGVRRENADVIHGLGSRSTLIVNGDDLGLLEAVSSCSAKKITFGTTPGCDLVAGDISTDSTGTRFRLNGTQHPLSVPLIGAHNALNALAAVAVGRRLGLTEGQIAEGLRNASGPEMRMQLRDIAGVHLLNDAYNANPASMRAALETIRVMRLGQRKIAVLGEMLELGAAHVEHHRDIGAMLPGCGFDRVACVGAGGKVIADAAEQSGFPPSRIARFENSKSCAEILPTWLVDGDLVLLKGSRGVHLELVADAIAARRPGPTRKAS